jgi:hypothetical protein
MSTAVNSWDVITSGSHTEAAMALGSRILPRGSSTCLHDEIDVTRRRSWEVFSSCSVGIEDWLSQIGHHLVWYLSQGRQHRCTCDHYVKVGGSSWREFHNGFGLFFGRHTGWTFEFRTLCPNKKTFFCDRTILI